MNTRPVSARRNTKGVSAVSLMLMLACGPAERAAAPPSSTHAHPLVVAEQRRPANISIEIRAPNRARWLSSTLSPASTPLGVVVTNHSPAPVDVSDLRVHLEAVREGVSFHCANEIGPAPDAREPPALESGESFEYERTMDCTLPLTGRYSVKTWVSFGQGPSRVTRPVRELALEVMAPDHLEPKPLSILPGLYGAVGSSALLVGESGRGSGRIAVALVNGAARPLALPTLRLAVRVFRSGSPIPCEDAPIKLDAPSPLAAGEPYRVPVDVSCLGLDTPGKYEVVVRLLLDERGDPARASEELGRLRVEISDDPARRMSPLLVR